MSLIIAAGRTAYDAQYDMLLRVVGGSERATQYPVNLILYLI